MRIQGLRSHQKLALVMSLAMIVAGCSSVPRDSSRVSPATARGSSGHAAIPALPPANSGRGGYYLDDGPGDQIPLGLENTPDAEPRVEPYLPRANRPYERFGKTYTPITDNRPFKQRGIGSWYGKKFHGNRTSSGEPYDMYKMTAAHPTLPIPSYARVTHLDSGRQIIVRINDRGPFHSGRIIDLSYTAALRLGYLGKGSGMLEVEHLSPQEIGRMAQARRAAEAGLPMMAGAQDKPVESAGYPPLQDSLVKDAGSPLPGKPVAGGYYLQLGAYAQAQNAETMRAQYAVAWADKLPPVEVVRSGPHYRLLSGPFETRQKAADAAQRIQQGGTDRPMVVQR